MGTLVAGKLDEISEAIGGLRASTAGLERAFSEHCRDDDRRHEENIAVQREANESIRKLTEVVTPLANAVGAMKPIVDQYQASRFKLVGAASVIMMLFGFIGWLIQTFITSIIHGVWKLLQG
jgi:hypothetical protein